MHRGTYVSQNMFFEVDSWKSVASTVIVHCQGSMTWVREKVTT